jgi:hypothetical protein
MKHSKIINPDLAVSPFEEVLKYAKLLLTSENGSSLISLYKKDNNLFLVHSKENEIVKTERISKNLAHIQFPNLIFG